jgi:hypothetical protein
MIIILPKEGDPLISPEKQKTFRMGVGMLLYLVKPKSVIVVAALFTGTWYLYHYFFRYTGTWYLVYCDGVFMFENFDEVLCLCFTHILDTKVIHNKAEGDWSCFVEEQ